MRDLSEQIAEVVQNIKAVFIESSLVAVLLRITTEFSLQDQRYSF